MEKNSLRSSSKLSYFWILFCSIILFLGLFFRLVNLDSKIYWVDEVATSLRISGFTKQEAIEQVSHRGLMSVEDLQKFQKVTPSKNINDILNALTSSPEHAPLYFIIAKYWTDLFGSSVLAIRSLSVVFSLLTLPCLYWLCLTLFQSPLVGLIAVLLMSISPLNVAYAQEARPYSLWITATILSHITLLRALEKSHCLNWALYTGTIILSFYTSLLSFLVVVGQILYVVIIENFCFKPRVIYQWLAISLGILAFSPWLFIIFQNWQRLQDNTTWMRMSINWIAMIVIWIYSLVTIFIESPIYRQIDFILLTRILIDLSLLILIFFSFYFLCQKTSPKIKLFIFVQFITPLIILRAIDLRIGGQSSTAIRYMIPSYLGIQLSVAYLFKNKLFSSSFQSLRQQKKWRIIFGGIILIGVFSGIFMLDKSPQYQKTRNLHNLPIAKIINQTHTPLLLAEPQEILDVISLSYSLNKATQIQFLSTANLSTLFTQCQNIFLFNPSQELQRNLKQSEKRLQLIQIYKPKLLISNEIYLSLWKVTKLSNNCPQNL